MIEQTMPKLLEILGLDEEPMGIFYTDELSFTLPSQMFVDMIERFDESFLTTKSWATVRKKIEKSRRTWKEI
jgi:hypothetical protein